MNQPTCSFFNATKLFSFILFAITMPLQAATITVNDTTDELNADGSCSLREAISSANGDTAVDGCTAGSGPDTITVPAGTYTLSLAGADEDSNATGDLDITSDVILVGAGRASTIIDGGGIDRVLDVRCTNSMMGCNGAAAVTVKKVTIQNGNESSGRGGGFRNRGDSSTLPVTLLEDCHVTNNTSTRGGGVGDEGKLTIRDCLIDHNTATGVGAGGGVDLFGNTVIEDSTVSDNTAAGNGGGIYNNRILAIRRTLIADNQAGTGAGGYYGINDTTSITNTTISGNSTTSGDGGGIGCGDGFNTCDIKLSHSTIAHNSAAGGSGGGLSRTMGTVTVRSSIVTDNTAGSNPDVSGTFVSDDYNIVENSTGSAGFGGTNDRIDVAFSVAALADNDGDTQTHAIGESSLAKDAGICTDVDDATVDEDQRGRDRPFGSACDIGAFEYAESNELTEETELPIGSYHCEDGGTRIKTGTDDDNDDVLDASEVDETTYQCNDEETAQATDDRGCSATASHESAGDAALLLLLLFAWMLQTPWWLRRRNRLG